MFDAVAKDLWTVIMWVMLIIAGLVALSAIASAGRELRRADRSIELAEELFDDLWGGGK